MCGKLYGEIDKMDRVAFEHRGEYNNNNAVTGAHDACVKKLQALGGAGYKPKYMKAVKAAAARHAAANAEFPCTGEEASKRGGWGNMNGCVEQTRSSTLVVDFVMVAGIGIGLLLVGGVGYFAFCRRRAGSAEKNANKDHETYGTLDA